jgi:hypothetical protein
MLRALNLKEQIIQKILTISSISLQRFLLNASGGGGELAS